jgi:rare lipoprotein A
MIVRVNDRGPYHGNRLIDVSEKVAEALDFKRMGTARVRVDYVGRASTRGSDDNKLLATLRDDGRPATIPGMTAPVMVAEAPQPQRQSVAFRDPPVPQAEERSQIVQSNSWFGSAGQGRPVQTAMATEAPVGARIVSNIPLPPERPFDLGTIPNAATPVASVVMPASSVALLPPTRPVSASLFYAAPDGPNARFAKDDPFRHMKPQRFVALKSKP